VVVPRHYHLCFVVQDIDEARCELSETLGLAWRPVRGGRLVEPPTHVVNG